MKQAYYFNFMLDSKMEYLTTKTLSTPSDTKINPKIFLRETQFS